jgi:ABC-type tungstate transport system permease subunit
MEAAKTQVIDPKRVIVLDCQKARKKWKSIFAPRCHHLIENTRGENSGFFVCHHMYENK